jgi:hypothetical protein
MSGNHNRRTTFLALVLLSLASPSVAQPHAGSLSFSVDLRTGVVDSSVPPYIVVEDPPVDANHDGWYETVLRINLNDPKIGNPYNVVEFQVEYDAEPAGQVNLNIGDSRTNDSGGGDAGTQSNDAEINIGTDEGNCTDLYIFGKDGTPTRGNLLRSSPSFVGKDVVARFTISDRHISWANDRGRSGSLSSPHLFALAGQPDREGQVNYDIYAAFNRVIAGPRRFGSGVKRVNVILRPGPPGAARRTFDEQPVGQMGSRPRPFAAARPSTDGGRRERRLPPGLERPKGQEHRTPSSFRAAVGYITGSGTSGVAVADLNGDGKPDLAAAVRGSNGVGVLLGRGDGTFGAATTYAAGADPFTVAVADLDGDGKLDLVTPNRLGNDVSVVLGHGDGTFGAPTGYAAGQGPEDVAVADLDGDGKLDLAVANIYGNSVSVLLGNGDGTFGPATAYTSGGSYTRRVAVADLNRDGKPDLVTASYQSRDGVSVLLGHGDGTFGAPTAYAAGSGPTGVAVGDFNRDGEPDLAVTDQDGNSVSMLLGRGDGTFGAPTTYAAGRHPNMVAMADLDSDGKLDLVTADHDGNSVSVLLGHGDGTFGAATTYTAGQGPNDVVVADLDGDGRPDLATANYYSNSVSVLLSGAHRRSGF